MLLLIIILVLLLAGGGATTDIRDGVRAAGSVSLEPSYS
jgi:hypothetical protein